MKFIFPAAALLPAAWWTAIIGLLLTVLLPVFAATSLPASQTTANLSGVAQVTDLLPVLAVAPTTVLSLLSAVRELPADPAQSLKLQLHCVLLKVPVHRSQYPFVHGRAHLKISLERAAPMCSSPFIWAMSCEVTWLITLEADEGLAIPHSLGCCCGTPALRGAPAESPRTTTPPLPLICPRLGTPLWEFTKCTTSGLTVLLAGLSTLGNLSGRKLRVNYLYCFEPIIWDTLCGIGLSLVAPFDKLVSKLSTIACRIPSTVCSVSVLVATLAGSPLSCISHWCTLMFSGPNAGSVIENMVSSASSSSGISLLCVEVTAGSCSGFLTRLPLSFPVMFAIRVFSIAAILSSIWWFTSCSRPGSSAPPFVCNGHSGPSMLVTLKWMAQAGACMWCGYHGSITGLLISSSLATSLWLLLSFFLSFFFPVLHSASVFGIPGTSDTDGALPAS
ncbi:hypothetical protein Pelo_2777 [Pelomyxa schiedti]|nr:hypothetical protein Pelo_2777 [Pelomyxa schiedti]